MYSITKETKLNLEMTLYEASIFLASIPESLLDGEVKELVEIVLHDAKNQMNLLKNLKPTDNVDIREFHQMD